MEYLFDAMQYVFVRNAKKKANFHQLQLHACYADSLALTDNEEDAHQEEYHGKDHTTDPQRFIIWKEDSEDQVQMH